MLHWILCLLWLTCLYNWIWSFRKILNPPGPAEFTLSPIMCLRSYSQFVLYVFTLAWPLFPWLIQIVGFQWAGSLQRTLEVMVSSPHLASRTDGLIRTKMCCTVWWVNGSNSDRGRSFCETKLSSKKHRAFLEVTACCLILKCWSTKKRSSTCHHMTWMNENIHGLWGHMRHGSNLVFFAVDLTRWSN